MHVYVYRNTKKRWGTAKHLRKTGPGQTELITKEMLTEGVERQKEKQSIRWAATNLLTT